jgi:hypothetical protein
MPRVMGRSFLTEPWDRSSRRAWALILVVAVIGVLIGVAVRGFGSSAETVRPADPLAAVRSNVRGLRVLFIGNSFTYFNSMPTMVAQLAEENASTPRKVLTVEYAPGGSHLANAVQDPALLRLITSVRWNIVVMQEQSQVPALPDSLVHESLPAVAKLARLIRRDGAIPVLFETWGYRQGDVGNFTGDSYAAMQARLHDGYADLAKQERIAVIPVGDTWSVALAEQPSLALWDSDGHHPSPEGSYLTAAVFNSAFDLLERHGGTPADPVLSSFADGLNPATAGWLRQIAYDAVQRGLASDRP